MHKSHSYTMHTPSNIQSIHNIVQCRVYHLVKGWIPGFPCYLGLAFGCLVRVREQVGFHIWVRICPVFRNLKTKRSEGLEELMDESIPLILQCRSIR